MKGLVLLVTIVFSTAFCFAQDKSYTITGSIFDVDLNGETIDLVELGEQANTTIQNTKVSGNTFSFSGSVDAPMLCMLLIENHKVVFVLENAKITVSIHRDSTNISGTKTNDNFQRFINQSNAYRKQITELHSSYQAAPEKSPEKALLLEQFEEMEKYWQSEVMVKFIEDNINNPAGLRAFKSLLPSLSIDELKRIIVSVDSVNLTHPYIQKAIEQINTSGSLQ